MPGDNRRVRVIVTGGNSGIGKGIASALAADGHRVTIACRTIPKAERALSEMTGDVDMKYADLADLPSGTYFAPVFRQWGRPRVTVPLAKARDLKHAAELWKRSTELTGCDWPVD